MVSSVLVYTAVQNVCSPLSKCSLSHDLHGVDLHRLLAPVGDGVRDGVDRRPALVVRCGDLGEDAVASVRLVQVGVGLQVDEELWMLEGRKCKVVRKLDKES